MSVYAPSPLMPAGLVMTPTSIGPLAGPGVNFPIWPDWVDTFVDLPPVLITDELLAVFDGCADLTIPCENWEITFPRESRVLNIRRL